MPPVASFTASQVSGIKPLTVVFTDQSSGVPTSYTWDFGDGTFSHDANPTHVYSRSGTYTVTLTSANNYGSNTITKTNYINISKKTKSIPVVARFSANVTTGKKPLIVNFIDESTGLPTERTWKFGDGKVSREANPVHTYNQIGTYTVSLTSTDNNDYNTIKIVDYINVTD